MKGAAAMLRCDGSFVIVYAIPKPSLLDQFGFSGLFGGVALGMIMVLSFSLPAVFR